MRAASPSKFEINRKVRGILVKHWIDLGRLSIRSSTNAVFIHGSLVKLTGQSDKLTSPILENLFQEINRVPGVRRVDVNFDNWTRDGSRGLWRERKQEAKIARLPDDDAKITSAVISIDQ